MFFSKAYNRISKQGFVKRDGHDDFETYLREPFVETDISYDQTLHAIKAETQRASLWEPSGQ